MTQKNFQNLAWHFITSLKYIIVITTLCTVSKSFAADLPTGGEVTAGSGSIAQSGTVMDIWQNTHSMTANWDSFSIGAGNTVNFHQPAADAVALNYIRGNEASQIYGSLNANGQVFLINPNGVLFAPGSQVDVGGLVASTMNLSQINLSQVNFDSSNYKFLGDSTSSIINQGNIHIKDGSTLAFVAAQITNLGNITANEGNILMAAGNAVTLDMGGVVKIKVDQGALNTLIEQGGAIKADGGYVYLTAKSAGDLATSVVNQSGIIEAKTLATGKKGEIFLLGDMTQGTTKISGTLDASAPNGGDGGFIETSAANLEVIDSAKITAGANMGKGGTWLIDPYDYTINLTAAANIASTLNSGTNVTITTTSSVSSYGGGLSGNGDITVSSAINKTSGGNATLTLQAANNIFLNAAISSTNNQLNLALIADSDADGGGFVSSNGSAITTNGGSLTFGNGATATIGGVSTLVGGDLYVDLTSSSTSFNTAGGNITVHGDLMMAARASGNKLVLDAGNGNITVDGTVNSANTFTKVAASSTSWTADESAATSGNSGTISDVGNSYLATSRSHLENSLIVYKNGTSDSSWIGGKRVSNAADWKWSEGPEGLLGSGGLKFYTQSGTFDDPQINFDVGGGLNIYGYAVGTAPVNNGGTAVSGVYNNWGSSEPTAVIGSSAAAKISSITGSWSAADTSNTLNYYIKETNLNNATLDAKLNGTFKVNNHEYGSLSSGTDYGNIKSVTLSKASSSSTPTSSSSTDTTITTATSTTPTAAAITMVQASVVNGINSNNITPHIFTKKHDGVKSGDMITTFNNKNSHHKNAIDTAKDFLDSTDNNLVLTSNAITK